MGANQPRLPLQDVEARLKESAVVSMGTEISQEDLSSINDLATQARNKLEGNPGYGDESCTLILFGALRSPSHTFLPKASPYTFPPLTSIWRR